MFANYFSGPMHRRLLISVCFLLAYVTSFFLSGQGAPQADIDHSWHVVMEYAFEQRLQFGRDIVFTHGPLGFLNTTVSQGHLAGLRITFALLWSGAVAWALTGLTLRIATPGRFLLFGWFLLVANLGRLEDHVLMVLLYGCVLLSGDPRRHRWQTLFFLVMAVLLALVKFTFLLAVFFAVASCALLLLLRRDYPAAILLPATVGGLFLFAWILSGQQLTNLFPYLKGSIELTGGFSAAMALPPRTGTLVAGVAVVVLCLTGLLLAGVAARRSAARSALLVVTAVYLYVSWKHGFVRADAHVLHFILPAPLLFGILLTDTMQAGMAASQRRLLAVLYLLVVCSCATAAELELPGLLRSRLGDAPRQFKESLTRIITAVSGSREQLFAALPVDAGGAKRPELPRISRQTGNRPVDVFNYTQWPAIGAGLNYRPRPVIQGYSAYTPYLQDLNRAYFRGERRPPYLLLSMETIDNRFPTLDDAPALLEILASYRPIALEGGFLLFKDSGRSSSASGLRLLHEQPLEIGAPLDLTRWQGLPLVMQVSIRPTVVERVVSFFYQPAALFLSTKAGGRESHYRFIPAMAERGFLVSPVIATNDAVIDLLLQADTAGPETIKIRRLPGYLNRFYSGRMTVRLFQADLPAAPPSAQYRQGLAGLRNHAIGPDR